MSVDKHTLQRWIAGAEVRFKKSCRPLSRIPIVKRIKRLADCTQEYVLTERIDLTRARDFHAQQTSEDILFASIQLPVFGKRGMGNDIGMAVASFKYKDREGEEHGVIAICAYTISGVVNKRRELKQVITIPLA
jgi:hypothetical protein